MDKKSHRLIKYKEGDFVAEGLFLNDSIKVGKHTAFYQNGKVQSTANYNNHGKLEGESLLFYESGKPWQKRFFSNGILNGVFIEFFENGSHKTKGYYYNNKVLGNVFHYDESGKMSAYNFIDLNGRNRIYISYYKDGSIVQELGKNQFLEDSINVSKNDTLQSDTLLLYTLLAKVPNTKTSMRILELSASGNVLNEIIYISSGSLQILKIPVKDSLSIIKIIGEQEDVQSKSRKTIVSEYNIK